MHFPKISGRTEGKPPQVPWALKSKPSRPRHLDHVGGSGTSQTHWSLLIHRVAGPGLGLVTGNIEAAAELQAFRESKGPPFQLQTPS